MKLAADCNAPVLKVHIVPFEADELALADAGEEVYEIDVLEGVAFDGAQELGHLLVLERRNLRLGPLRQDGKAGGVHLQVADAYGLLERTMEHAVDVFHCLGIERLLFVLVVFQTVDELLDLYRRQLLEPFLAQDRLDVILHSGLVGLPGVRLGAACVFGQPDIQPLGDGQCAGLLIDAVINFSRNFAESLPYFLLGLAIDGALGLPPGRRVEARRISGLPTSVGALSDGSGPLRVFLTLARHFYSFPGY